MTGVTESGATVAQRMEARFAAARGVADLVCYEGYILYPYHAADGKNRGGTRFQWGVLVPPSWGQVDPSERSSLRSELVVDPGSGPLAAVRVRFLQLQRRTVEVADADAPGGFRATATLEVGSRRWVEWDEAVEREVDLGIVPVLPLARASRQVAFDFPAVGEVEVVTDPRGGGRAAGRVIRTIESVSGVARIAARWADGPGILVKLTIEVDNTTSWSPEGASREDAMLRSLISVHALATVHDAAFCSALDPPEGAESAVAGCQSVGSYPVLLGPAGATDLMLAAPIILYDYPAIAPESEGDFHDACEIDELLALRVLTLTDDEKAEARATDPRARAIIDRCDNMAGDSWGKLHGALREVRMGEADADPEPPLGADPVADSAFDPWTDTVDVRGAVVGKGSRVRLQPSLQADLHDMFLGGREATVAGVFHDVDGGVHVAVTVDQDPAAEMYEAQGRFYYFHPDEVEPIEGGKSAGSGPAAM